MGTSVKLGKILGIPFGINYSWLIIFAVLTSILSVSFFPSRFPAWPVEAYWLISLAASLIFFGSIVAHELAHSVVSIATGVPVVGITLFIFGGVAQIEREATRPRNEFLVAVAGPLASLVIGVLFYALSLVTHSLSEALSAMSYWLGISNLALAAFNLLPGFPLDGGRALRAIIWSLNGSFLTATRIASICGRICGYGFVLVGLLYILNGAIPDGIWLGVVGWFLDNTANASFRQAATRHGLQGITARDLMSSDFPRISSSLSIGRLVQEHLLRSPQRTYLVAEGEILLGLVSPQGIKRVPRGEWDTTAVRKVMVPLADLKKASTTEDAVSLLDRMDELNLAQLPVEEEGQIVGLVRRDSLLQLIRTRAELGV